MDRSNMSWNNKISDKEILEKHFSIGYLINTNLHLYADLKDMVLSTYKVKAKFEYLGYNGQQIYCNGQKLVYCKSKFDKQVSLGKNVKYLEGDLVPCGSNRYPAIAYKEGMYCVLEFISYGLPYVHKLNGWSISVITTERWEE